MNTQQIKALEDRCWDLADDYRAASVHRAHAEALLAHCPDSSIFREARFNAGMAEWDAFDAMRTATGELMIHVGITMANHIREAAIQQATRAALVALKKALARPEVAA